MQGATFMATGLAVLAFLSAAGLYAATGGRAADRLAVQSAGKASSEPPRLRAPRDDASRPAGSPGDLHRAERRSAIRLARQDPLLERSRPHMNALKGSGNAEMARDRRRNGRFGVGYEWRMRQRRGPEPAPRDERGGSRRGGGGPGGSGG